MYNASFTNTVLPYLQNSFNGKKKTYNEEAGTGKAVGKNQTFKLKEVASAEGRKDL